MAKPARAEVRVSDSSFRRKMEKFPVVFDQEAQDVLLRLGKIGEEEMRRSIKDAPTPFARIRSSVGLGPPKGRAQTFRMYKSVGYMLRAGAKRLEIAVGYLKGPKRAYYKIQDGSDSPNGGFVNKWRFVGFGPGTSGPNAPSGFLFAPARPRITEGTHALRNARELMVKRSDKLFAEAEKKIVRKSGGASSRRGRP